MIPLKYGVVRRHELGEEQVKQSQDLIQKLQIPS